MKNPKRSGANKLTPDEQNEAGFIPPSAPRTRLKLSPTHNQHIKTPPNSGVRIPKTPVNEKLFNNINY